MGERILDELEDVTRQRDALIQLVGELRDELRSWKESEVTPSASWELLPDGRSFAILNGPRAARAYAGGLDANDEWQDGLWEIDGGGFCASGQEPTREEAMVRASAVHLALTAPATQPMRTPPNTPTTGS